MYNKKVLERFENPKFAGEIKNPDGIGQVGNLKCGDIMKIFIKVNNGIISDIKFKTYGCVAAIASSDMLCEMALGMKVDDAYKIKDYDIVKKLGELPNIKYHCSVLGASALRKAIEDYKKRLP